MWSWVDLGECDNKRGWKWFYVPHRNNEFEMTTNSPSNVYISNGQLYIMPTLTSDTISGGYSSVMDGATYTLDGCTASNGRSVRERPQSFADRVVGVSDQGAFVLPYLKRQATGNGTTANTTVTGGNSTTSGGGTNSTTSSNSTSSTSGGTNACTAVSSAQAGTVINPVMSGRINTRGTKSIKYGKVEVRAKLPQGDWLWPAIWMLPAGNDTSTAQGTGVYGGWPVSGEIDVCGLFRVAFDANVFGADHGSERQPAFVPFPRIQLCALEHELWSFPFRQYTHIDR